MIDVDIGNLQFTRSPVRQARFWLVGVGSRAISRSSDLSLQLAAASFHPTELEVRCFDWRISGTWQTMLITLALFILWILSMYFYLPLPIVVLLFAALATGTTITLWHAWMARKQRLATVGEQDTKL